MDAAILSLGHLVKASGDRRSPPVVRVTPTASGQVEVLLAIPGHHVAGGGVCTPEELLQFGREIVALAADLLTEAWSKVPPATVVA